MYDICGINLYYNNYSGHFSNCCTFGASKELKFGYINIIHCQPIFL